MESYEKPNLTKNYIIIFLMVFTARAIRATKNQKINYTTVLPGIRLSGANTFEFSDRNNLVSSWLSFFSVVSNIEGTGLGCVASKVLKTLQ